MAENEGEGESRELTAEEIHALTGMTPADLDALHEDDRAAAPPNEPEPHEFPVGPSRPGEFATPTNPQRDKPGMPPRPELPGLTIPMMAVCFQALHQMSGYFEWGGLCAQRETDSTVILSLPARDEAGAGTGHHRFRVKLPELLVVETEPVA